MMTDTITPLLNRVVHALTSGHFLFLAGMSLILLHQRTRNSAYNALLFLGIFTYLLLFYAGLIQVFQMAGDNICQIAYWKILFHPNLTGSIGASYTKPGQLLILGALFELSHLAGEAVFKTGLCLIMTCCVWILAKIATEIGGREAGILAFLAATLTFRAEFLDGSYVIFLIPAVFTGLWLYFFSAKHRALGRCLLALSILFHIQSITVLIVVWLRLLIKKEWRELATFSAMVTGALVIWFAVILRVQGAFNRISSAAGAGYVSPENTPFSYDNKPVYILKALLADMTGNHAVILFLILAAIGVAGSYRQHFNIYLSVFSVPILLIINVVALNGGISLGRHFSLIYAFGCSVGSAVLVKTFARPIGRYPVILTGMVLILFVPFMVNPAFNTPIPFQDYVSSAATLLHNNNLPVGTRLMSEDDLLYPIVAQSPDRFQTLSALQYFNVMNETRRRQILSQTDYIWIVTNNRHPFYYLNYTPIPAWDTDKFRLMLHELKQDRQQKKLYGFLFIPVEIGTEHLLIRIKQDISV